MKKKRRRNPSVYVVGEIPGRIERIFYHRTGPGVSKKMAGPYQHGFSSSAKILAMSDGSLRIVPTKRGRKLWVNLPH